MKLEDLKPYFLEDVEIFGYSDFNIDSLKAMHLAKAGDMTYILASRAPTLEELYKNPARVIITDLRVTDGEFLNSQEKKCLIVTSNPRLQMAKLSHLFDYKKISNIAIPYTYIDKNSKIGENTDVAPGVIIYAGVTIGKNCIIHAGTVIGADGFGYEQDPKTGEWFKIAHLGGVIIGDNVEIGANTCIDRGTLGDTIIEDGVKIDNLVHIAHNVHMKKNSVVIAQSMIAGSCIIEKGAWIAPCSAIREGRTIGKNALVGLGSVVVKNVEDDQTVMGVPAKVK